MITMIVPYYRQPKMLERQLETYAGYPRYVRDVIKLLIVDDGSPEPAESLVSVWYAQGRLPIALYRVTVDIPWNRSMARNLGSREASTPWLLHVDTDHLMLAKAAEALVDALPTLDPKAWYKFRRFRVGPADDTRNKDSIPRDAKYGEIKPHVDSYLCTKKLYWQVGGYDPDYAGCLGGGGSFLRQLKKAGRESMAPADISLHVCTRSVAPDSSIFSLDRSTEEYGRRRRIKERAGNTKVTDPIRYPWTRIL